MIDRFQSRAGGYFTTNILNQGVLNHPSTQRFIHRDIVSSFKEALKKNGYSIDGLHLSIFGNPRFNTKSDLWFGGLTFAINDMQKYDIQIVSYKVVENKYKANLNLVLYDHFGLDPEDVIEYDYDLFESWFVLQHSRGFKPFMTKIEISIEINGTK